MHILIADDIGSIRSLVKGVLGELGPHLVEEAATGRAALEKLIGGSFDLLICDWHMPEMSGLELLKIVRADPTLATLPVVLLTGEVSRDLIGEALQLGINGYIAKPFKPASLVTNIRGILEKIRR